MAQKFLIDPATGGDLEFNYQKAPNYRTIHADGALLSSTPRGYFALTLYNERAVIPRQTRRHVKSQEGDVLTLGEEEVSDSLPGIMRQVETTIIIDQRTLNELRDILQQIDADMDEEG